MRNSGEIETISEIFEVPYDYLWDYISNPLMFPVLYPNWIAKINLSRKDEYRAENPSGEKFIITPDLNKDYGIIDFRTMHDNGESKTYRSRIVSIASRKTVLLRLIYHLNNEDDARFNWDNYKKNIQNDYENARKIVENVFLNSLV